MVNQMHSIKDQAEISFSEEEEILFGSHTDLESNKNHSFKTVKHTY